MVIKCILMLISSLLVITFGCTGFIFGVVATVIYREIGIKTLWFAFNYVIFERVDLYLQDIIKNFTDNFEIREYGVKSVDNEEIRSMCTESIKITWENFDLHFEDEFAIFSKDKKQYYINMFNGILNEDRYDVSDIILGNFSKNWKIGPFSFLVKDNKMYFTHDKTNIIFPVDEFDYLDNEFLFFSKSNKYIFKKYSNKWYNTEILNKESSVENLYEIFKKESFFQNENDSNNICKISDTFRLLNDF